jgi:hypothetical protein
MYINMCVSNTSDNYASQMIRRLLDEKNSFEKVENEQGTLDWCCYKYGYIFA